MQNRDAPAYQEYAAAMMAKIEYRTMSLAARGLLYSMRLECWVNGMLPANPDRLAKILGFTVDEIKNSLPEVQSFFANVDGFLISPELDNYKIHLAEGKKRMSDGGKKAMQKRYGKKP